ncbi:MAG TPA: cytochrome c [Bacteroidia bacterium]|nr:cytochrome c [Bacteroidia bacterium]
MKKSKIKNQKLAGLLFVSFLLAVLIAAAQTTSWKAPATAAKVKNPVASDATSIEAGKKIYIKECNKCHGKKGMGDGPNSADLDKKLEPLNNAEVKGQTDGELFWKISEGKKPMPSTKKTLTDDQRWQLINYIRTFSSPTK